MSMIEVDPKLFIKCRLCLEDSGIYQIVPVIREQISYCFEINVEPFDSLPQLICKKCQAILCDYSNVKKTYIEKQEQLKNRIKDNKLTQNIEDRGSTIKRENIEPVAISENSKSKRRKVNVTSLSNESERKRKSSKQVIKNSLNKLEDKKQDWKKNYHKTFACRLCNSNWYSRKAAFYHRSTHDILKSKYKDVFNKYCVVELHKVDNKPNLTESLDQIVYSKNNIIGKGCLDYSVAYKYIEKYSSHSSDDDIKPDVNLQENSDSSSKSNNIVVCRKRRRIYSRSSSETVVLKNESYGTKSLENECINIADTDSDDETKTQREKRKVNKNNSMGIIKESAVAKLINSTFNKYLKKHDQSEKPSLEQMNRKITSIGRQIINKRGFNCSRVMKYVEFMNLNVIWLTRSPLNVTSNSNFYKIIPRPRYHHEKNINCFEGYRKKYVKEQNRTDETNVLGKSAALASLSESSDIVKVLNNVTTIIKTTALFVSSENQVNMPSTDNSLAVYTPNEKPTSTFASKLATLTNAAVTGDTRKILNAYPAANPRQLKKFTNDTKKDKSKPSVTVPTLEINPGEVSSEVTSGYSNNITFTASLAEAEITKINKETTNDSANNSKLVISSNKIPKPTAPRIKVKSVTELMSKETLNRMNESSVTVETQNQTQNTTAFNIFETFQNQNQAYLSLNSTNSSKYHSDDYVILDTIELPNTKTNSPFRYFRMLLQVHNLTLLDTDAPLTVNFNTLIRFKVLYKQETKDHPVILCLSLFCADNVFCLKIKDRNEDKINMSKISANWQWEILKIYRGEVVNKMLNNAQKISQEVYKNTNRFLCLLKSINFVPG